MALSCLRKSNLITNLIRNRRFNSSSSSAINEKNFAGKNAYDVLGVSETSSFDEIKASFRKLAKLTHPDLSSSSSSSSSTDSNTSDQFIQILAAYEILSDSGRRSHYDSYLFSQRKILQKRPTHGSSMYIYNSHVALSNRMEVVEWLRWYRVAIKDIVSHKQVVSGSGYFDVLQRDFYSAIHAAYYGPVIECVDSLPDCFEAEERSTDGIPEVLHLVSGRDLFGIVRIVNNLPQLSHSSHETLTSFTSNGSGLSQSVKNISISMNTGSLDNAEIPEVQVRHHLDGSSDAYRNLELHISGRVVAMASRVPPKSCSNGVQNEDAEDHIHVFLSSNECPVYASKMYGSSFSSGSFGSRILLGTITGLGTNPEEASCFVYDNSGTKTHVLLKHRTLLVKHLHWFQVGDEVSVCECRCSRARLPPSKFWLFEPRCAMHDIGGWYVETYGRSKKGKTVPSQRHWDGFDVFVDHEKRLHPAVYLLGLAYRTLDLEEAKKRKWRVKDIVEPRLVSFVHWLKRYV